MCSALNFLPATKCQAKKAYRWYWQRSWEERAEWVSRIEETEMALTLTFGNLMPHDVLVRNLIRLQKVVPLNDERVYIRVSRSSPKSYFTYFTAKLKSEMALC